MSGRPIDSGELNKVVRGAVESSYATAYRHISDLATRVRSLERAEYAYLTSVSTAAKLPALHAGGLAFVVDEARWYYCNGTQWLLAAGGESGGGETQIHVLATGLGLGPYHTINNALEGDVLRATGAASARFMQLAHDDLGGITTDQHHAKLHNITDANHHQISAADWGIVGAVGGNTLGIHNPSADVSGSSKEAILKSDSAGYLKLVRAIASDRVQAPRVESAAGDLIVAAANDIVMTPTHWTMFADNKDMRSQSHTPGFLGQGWRISWPETDKPHLDIRSIYAEQLEVTAFQADIMRVRIAEDFLTQGMAFTALAFTTPSSIGGAVTVTLEDNPVLGNAQLFLPNEWVLFNIIQRDAGLIVAQIWGQVSDYVDLLPDTNGVERQTWTFTLRNGRTNFTIPKGSLALAFGVSGQKNGYIHHSVLSTAYGPWTRYATWTGSDPYTVANRRYHVQTGNLHGLVDIDSDRYGIAAGDNLAKTPNDPTNPFKGFTADNVGGMRLFNTDISAYVGAVQKMYIAATGQEMWLGTSSSDKRFSYLNGNLTVIGTLQAGGGKFRADSEGVKIRVNPGSAFEAEDERIEWLYNSLDTGLRTWIGTRVYGTSDGDSQLALSALGGISGAWGSVALRAREYGQSTLLDTEGATLIVTPRNVWVGPQAGLRISSSASDISTPVAGGQLYAETIYTEDLIVTGTLSGEALTGASWEYPGDMLINAAASTDTAVTINNLGAGRADLIVDRNIAVGGNVDGVDVSTFKSAYDTHAANANAHHNQAHAYDSTDHTGTLSWAKVNKTSASLADLPTRLYADLQTRTHVLATSGGLGPDHSISGGMVGYVLRASGATAAAFAQLQHGDLGGVTADQHHAQVHGIISSNHTVTGSQYQIVGIPSTANTLGLLTPSSSPVTNTLAMTDGSSRLTLINLTTSNAILANGGVDYGADTLSEDTNYLILSGTKPFSTAVTLRASGWSIVTSGAAIFTNVTTPTVDAAGNLTLVPTSDLILDPASNITKTAANVWLQSANYASETTGWAISPSGYIDARALQVNELIAKSFIVDLEQALAGGEIVTKSVTKLANDFTAPYDTTAAVTFREKATAVSSIAGIQIAKPVGTLEFDFMLATIVMSSAATITTAPAGWALVAASVYATTSLYVYGKLAGAVEELNYIWAFSGVSEAIGEIQAYSGVNTTTPIYSYSTQGGVGTGIVLPGVSTIVGGVGEVLLSGVYDTTNVGTSMTPPVGFTERDDMLGLAHTWLGTASGIQSLPGASGSISSTLSLSHNWAGVLVALRPATWATVYIAVEDLPSAAGMAVFESGDIIRLRQFSRAGGGLNISNCWGTVTNYVGNGNGTQTWVFTRSAPPNAGIISAGTSIAAGAVVLDYGTDGDGFYEINAYSGTYAATAPYAQVVKWVGHPATGQVVRTREGNLEGITAQPNEYGLWAGAKGASPIGTADQYIRVSNLGVLINNVPIKLYNAGGVQTIQLNSDGTAWFKDGSGNTKMNWDGTNLSISGSLTVTSGVLGGGGDNLLLNSSFETDTDGNGLSDQWTDYNNSYATEPSTMTRVTGRNGGYAQRLTWGVANTSTKGFYTTSYVATSGPRKAGVSYVTSWWAYQTLNVPRSMETRHNIHPTEVEWLLNPTPENGRWQRWAVRQKWSVDNTDGVYISVINGSACTGSIDFDDVMVTEGETLSNYQPRAAEILPGTITGDMVQISSYLAIGAASWGANGIRMEYNSGSPRFYAGNGGTNYIKYEAGVVTLSGTLSAAGGIVVADSSGLRVKASTVKTTANMYSFCDSSSVVFGGTYSTYTASSQMVVLASSGVGAGRTSYASMIASNTTNSSITTVEASSSSGVVKMRLSSVYGGTATIEFEGASNISLGGANLWHAGNLTPANYALVSGTNFSGGISAPTLEATGTGAQVVLDSRSGNTGFVIYNTADYLRIWTAAGDRVKIDTNGSIYIQGSIVNTGGQYYSDNEHRFFNGTGGSYQNVRLGGVVVVNGAYYSDSAHSFMNNAGSIYQNIQVGNATVVYGGFYSNNAFVFYNGAGSGYQTVTAGNLDNIYGGMYSDSAFQFLATNGVAQQTRMGSLLVSSSYSSTYVGYVPTNGIWCQGAIRINTNTASVYAFDVAGEARVSGSMRADVALSLKPQASPPGVSSTYGVLYVNASGQLYYMKPNGSSPGYYITG